MILSGLNSSATRSTNRRIARRSTIWSIIVLFNVVFVSGLLSMRLVFNVLSLLSSILCIAVVILWFRSYGTADYLSYCLERSEYGVISTVGRILIYNEAAIEPFRWKAPFGVQRAARPAPDSISAYAMPQAARQASWMGFGVISGNNGKYAASVRFVPHWFVALLLVIMPLLWLRRRFRKTPDQGFQLINQPELVGTK